MTPLEVTVKTLEDHRWIDRDSGWGTCKCEEDQPYSTPAVQHPTHVAGMLAAAGVLPTVQEWGVRRPEIPDVDLIHDSIHGAYGDRDALLDHYGDDFDLTVVTRFTGATPWTEAGG